MPFLRLMEQLVKYVASELESIEVHKQKIATAVESIQSKRKLFKVQVRCVHVHTSTAHKHCKMISC